MARLREKKLEIRCTEEEIRNIKENAKSQGYEKNIGEWARKKLLRKRRRSNESS